MIAMVTAAAVAVEAGTALRPLAEGEGKTAMITMVTAAVVAVKGHANIFCEIFLPSSKNNHVNNTSDIPGVCDSKYMFIKRCDWLFCIKNIWGSLRYHWPFPWNWRTYGRSYLLQSKGGLVRQVVSHHRVIHFCYPLATESELEGI